MSKKTAWGGKRPGAGRKSAPSKAVRLKLATIARLQALRASPRETFDAVIVRIMDGAT